MSEVANIPGGVVHTLPDDLAAALVACPTALATWHDITPLARNQMGLLGDLPKAGRHP